MKLEKRNAKSVEILHITNTVKAIVRTKRNLFLTLFERENPQKKESTLTDRAVRIIK
jgi:hypothetical protein